MALGERFWTSLQRDAWRVLLPWAIGFAFVFLSTPFARVIGEPAFASAGLFAGLAFFVVAISHILRRLYFPHLDLQALAKLAMGHPIGAGLVFLGVCIVLASFALMTGGMLRS